MAWFSLLILTYFTEWFDLLSSRVFRHYLRAISWQGLTNILRNLRFLYFEQRGIHLAVAVSTTNALFAASLPRLAQILNSSVDLLALG